MTAIVRNLRIPRSPSCAPASAVPDAVAYAPVSNGFSIADLNDPGMLDVVGFHAATPQLISDFARGAL